MFLSIKFQKQSVRKAIGQFFKLMIILMTMQPTVFASTHCNPGAKIEDTLRTLSAIRGDFFILDNATDSVRIRGLRDPRVQMMYFLFAAEEDPVGLDPGLSTDGRWRAIHLADILREQNIVAFFSTPFRRNILTLQPVCDKKQIQPLYYDQADLKSLFDQVNKFGSGDVVIMIHKESFGKMLELFSGQKHTINVDNQPANRIFVLERSLVGSSRLSVYTYDIR
ncbi:MAG: histidine phosphatase family protein [Saprospiraceae bacterium]